MKVRVLRNRHAPSANAAIRASTGAKAWDIGDGSLEIMW
jgi:hypothetical protein